jgi:ubiquinone/menaquinone biosynthesis C-methylase UbiE
MAKDLFSEQSKSYAAFRPAYPKELFDYIVQFAEKRNRAWDCATGNGQAAKALADYFEKVEASDISQAQVNNAIQIPNIEYHVCPAEETPFEDNSFDLISVAQAYHWLNWKKFHDEAERVGKPNCVVAVWGYNLLVCNDEKVNALIHHFYRDITGSYWDYERRYVDDGYTTVDFEFVQLPAHKFETRMRWTRKHLEGFFRSWSAVQNFIKQNQLDPVTTIEKEIDAVWNEVEEKEISFPIFMKIGRIRK